MRIEKNKGFNKLQELFTDHFQKELSGTPMEVGFLLVIRNINNKMFGLIVAENANQEIAIQYLTLLNVIASTGFIEASCVTTLLSCQDDKDNHFGMVLINTHPKLANDYLRLLGNLLRQHPLLAEMLFVLLNLTNKARWRPQDLKSCIENKNKSIMPIYTAFVAQCIYQLLISNKISPKEYEKFGYLKKEISSYIQSIEPQELRAVILERALNEKDSLGKFFYMKRIIRQPSVRRGSLSELSTALSTLNLSATSENPQSFLNKMRSNSTTTFSSCASTSDDKEEDDDNNTVETKLFHG